MMIWNTIDYWWLVTKTLRLFPAVHIFEFWSRQNCFIWQSIRTQVNSSYLWRFRLLYPSHSITFWPLRSATLEKWNNVVQRGYNVLNVATTKRQRGWTWLQRGDSVAKRDQTWHNVNWKCEFWTCSKFDLQLATLSPRCSHVQPRCSHVVAMFFYSQGRSKPKYNVFPNVAERGGHNVILWLRYEKTNSSVGCLYKLVLPIWY